MPLSSTRLDRYLKKVLNLSKHDIRCLLAQKKVEVDGIAINDITHPINYFSHILLDGQTLQHHTPYYVMLNKPVGVVSATKDSEHKTVMDLLNYEFSNQLHIAGRLDLNSSGLVLLTNDSRWSSRLTAPESKVTKRYRVRLEKSLTQEYVQAFAEGMYFPYEDITTQPVKLRIVEPFVAELDLTEGRYHQIKRMFGRFRNPVKALHRYAIGDLVLDDDLLSGQSRLIDCGDVFGTVK